MRQFLDRLSYLSFPHVTSGYVLANLFLIPSSKKDFAVVRYARMMGSGGEGEAGGIPGQLAASSLSLDLRTFAPASDTTSWNEGVAGRRSGPLPIKKQR